MIIISNKLKVNNLCKNNLCVVTDFDKTITSYNSNSSLGVFSKFLTKKYEKEKEKLNEKEKNFILINKSKEEKTNFFKYIWFQKFSLLKTFLNDSQIIKDIVESEEFIFRKDAIDTLNYLQRKYKVIINSSGFGNLIVELLKKEGCRFDNLVIFSNFINYFEHDDYKYSSIISSENKNNSKYLNYLQRYNNFLLLGDTLSDLTMVPENKEVCSIGFLDCQYDEYLNDFIENFDIVATENEPYSGPIKKLHL